MQQTSWDRRDVLWGLSAMAGAGMLGATARPATAQQVKYSSGTEPPKLKVPANACDCHHHIYGSEYKVDPRATLRPGDATVDDYRAFQKRYMKQYGKACRSPPLRHHLARRRVRVEAIL